MYHSGIVFWKTKDAEEHRVYQNVGFTEGKVNSWILLLCQDGGRRGSSRTKKFSSVISKKNAYWFNK